jgi:hypothetical protein
LGQARGKKHADWVFKRHAFTGAGYIKLAVHTNMEIDVFLTVFSSRLSKIRQNPEICWTKSQKQGSKQNRVN